MRYWWGTGVGRGEMVVREGLGDGGREYGRERRGGGVGMGWEGCTGRGEGHWEERYWDRVGRDTGRGNWDRVGTVAGEALGVALVMYWERVGGHWASDCRGTARGKGEKRDQWALGGDTALG